MAARNDIPQDMQNGLSNRIFAFVISLPEIQTAQVVSCYLHIGSEVQTDEIVRWLLSHRKRVIVPVTNRTEHRLSFSEVRQPETELQTGAMGIPEPKPQFLRPVPLESSDAILLPGVAWDLDGYRLGYGAGYYDRSINRLRKNIPSVGLAYESQIVNRIPRSRFDRPVHKIVTERRVIVAPQKR